MELLDAPVNMSRLDSDRTPFRNPVPVRVVIATDDAFRSIGARIIQGRNFAPIDADPEASLDDWDTVKFPGVAIVSKSAVDTFGPRLDVGQYISVQGSAHRSLRIIGVVTDISFASNRSSSEPVVYLPFGQEPTDRLNVFVRYRGDLRPIRAAAETVVAGFGDYLALNRIETMRDVEEVSLARQRAAATLAALVATTAIVVSLAGILALFLRLAANNRVSYAIRLAIGASPTQIMLSILTDGARVAIGGCTLGGAGAFIAVRWLASYQSGGSALDVKTIVILSIGNGLFALLACTGPALQASRTDAASVLRTSTT